MLRPLKEEKLEIRGKGRKLGLRGIMGRRNKIKASRVSYKSLSRLQKEVDLATSVSYSSVQLNWFILGIAFMCIFKRSRRQFALGA